MTTGLQQCTFFDPRGVFSLKKNGYRHTSTALAELVDNSIQAGAKNVEIVLIQRPLGKSRKQWHVQEVFIFDDGEGMPPEILQIALRFGGGMRHGAQAGLGKFGMGLPNSSASQCNRFEVYSWQNEGAIFRNYFDFHEILQEGTGLLPLVDQVNTLPKKAVETLQTVSKSGTLVHWIDCDNVKPKKAATIIKQMMVPLGRTFRYYLKDGVNVRIRVFDDNGHSLSEKKELATKLKPVDPLFLMKNCYYPEKCQETGPTNEPFTEPLEQQIIFEESLDDGSIRQHIATLKFSIATPETQKKGGGGELGKHYGESNGISVVRSKREIKLDSFGFIGDVSDPRHRWWSCEVSFEPISDDLFGLDNSKQNVHNFRKIDPRDYGMLSEGEEDSDPELVFMYKISQCISGNITEMLKRIKELNKGKKTKTCFNPDISCNGQIIDGICDTCRFSPKHCNIHPPVLLSNDGKCHLCEKFDPVPSPFKPPSPEVNPSTKEEKELSDFLTKRYEEYRTDKGKLDLAVNWFFHTPHSQVIIFDNMGPGVLYDYKVIGTRTLIEVNSNHEFYDTFIEPILNSEDTNELAPILLFFGALVEAERSSEDSSGVVEEFRGQVGLKLNKGIRFWRDHALA